MNAGWDRLRRGKPVATLDGFNRGNDEESRLNSIFAAIFSDGGGREALDYLRSVTVNAVLAPSQCEPNALLHLEGQRYLVHLIDKRVEQGQREKANGRRSSSG
tara:strand:- start:1822 stop:2130 length:309 start_codon:yes stop_codon:yes gene_type:complete